MVYTSARVAVVFGILVDFVIHWEGEMSAECAHRRPKPSWRAGGALGRGRLPRMGTVLYRLQRFRV